MSAASGIRARNVERLDEVQRLMESNAHLNEGEDYQRLEELLSKLSMYINVLDCGASHETPKGVDNGGAPSGLSMRQIRSRA